MVEVYRIYDFKYDEKIFMNNFKNTIVEKGYNTLSLFRDLLKTIGINSYDTARSYYNKRRVIPVDILTKLSIKFDMNVNQLMFPNSIPVDIYNKNIANNFASYKRTFDCFNTVFYLYNDAIHPEIITLKFDNLINIYSEIENATNQLSLIISKYNYLLQKYYFAGLNDEELKDISIFTENFIVDRNTYKKPVWDELINWKNNLKTFNFIKDFYEKYTFSLHNKMCFELLELMKNNLPNKLYLLISNLLPEVERNCTIGVDKK